METTIVHAYISVSLLLAAVDLVVAWKCFERKSDTAQWLSYTVVCAVLVDVSYLASILSDNYFTASVMTSAYFASIDWMLVMLVTFIIMFTGQAENRFNVIWSKFIKVYALFDTAVFAVNPVREIAITYVDLGRSVARFRFVMKPLYQAHLIFSYLMVAYTLTILVLRIIRTPKKYRNQYSFILWGILAIVAVNCTYLYLPQDSPLAMIDYSICMYSVVILMLYWNCFNYTENQMLGGLSLTVFENIGQGIVLFDYEGNLVMKNDRAVALLPMVTFEKKMAAENFLTQCGIPAKVDHYSKPYSLQFYVSAGEREHALRCDYRPLKDSSEKLLGSLYVFTDAEMETDLLTGFHRWFAFKQFAAERKNKERSVAAVVFDISGLAEVNRNSGMEAGDLLLRELAQLMRQAYPTDSYFVRGHEARLIVLCFDETEKNMLEKAADVAEAFSGNVQYAASAPEEPGNDVLEAISEASKALQVKKLMDPRSRDSEILTSLVRALKECDSDTEAHVKRTQIMGEKLGYRIGLTDVQRSNLRLLCLLHDIGKIGIPLDILNKPGKLTAEEWTVIRSHVDKGYEIAMSSDRLSGIADMILHHHERWDGEGYPSGLSREDIPLLSRVIALVDAYDAMVNNRRYRKAMTVNEALRELKRCAGTQFDPYIAAEFIHMLQEDKGVEDSGFLDTAGEAENSITQIIEVDENVSVFPVHFSKYYLDDNDIIVDVDDAFTEITGFTREDIQKNPMSQMDLVPEEERTGYIAVVTASLSKSSTVYLEHKLQRKDGTIIYVLCYSEKMFDATVNAGRTRIVISDSGDTFVMRNMAKTGKIPE